MLRGAQAFIPATGSIIGVSSGSRWPHHSTIYVHKHTLKHTSTLRRITVSVQYAGRGNLWPKKKVCRIHYWNEHNMYWLFFGQWLTDGHQTCNLERFAILFKFAIVSKTFAQIFNVKNFFWPIPFGLLITACCDERLFKKKIGLIVQKSFSEYCMLAWSTEKVR